MDAYSLAGIFVSALLASTLLPGGSEVALGVMLHQNAAPAGLLWLAATTGNTLGGMISWLMGRAARGLRAPEQLDHPRVRRTVGLLQAKGAPVLILSWLPVVGDPLCLAAGWLGLRWLPSLLWIAVGKGLRYAALIVLLTAGGISP